MSFGDSPRYPPFIELAPEPRGSRPAGKVRIPYEIPGEGFGALEYLKVRNLGADHLGVTRTLYRMSDEDYIANNRGHLSPSSRSGEGRNR
jgi:hypothetical protein